MSRPCWSIASATLVVSLKLSTLFCPFDQCFRLVGLIRSHWRGFSGGTEVWQNIAEFFTGLRANAIVMGGRGNA